MYVCCSAVLTWYRSCRTSTMSGSRCSSCRPTSGRRCSALDVYRPAKSWNQLELTQRCHNHHTSLYASTNTHARPHSADVLQRTMSIQIKSNQIYLLKYITYPLVRFVVDLSLNLFSTRAAFLHRGLYVLLMFFLYFSLFFLARRSLSE